MMKSLLIAVALIVVSGSAQAGPQKSFGCGYASQFGGGEYKQFLKKNAHNPMAANLLRHYTGIWQFQEEKRICDSYGRGEPAEFGCLIDRRDYDAILALMPKNYQSRSAAELNKWAAERDVSLAQEGTRYRNIAFNACVKAGAYKGKLREVN